MIGLRANFTASAASTAHRALLSRRLDESLDETIPMSNMWFSCSENNHACQNAAYCCCDTGYALNSNNVCVLVPTTTTARPFVEETIPGSDFWVSCTVNMHNCMEAAYCCCDPDFHFYNGVCWEDDSTTTVRPTRAEHSAHRVDNSGGEEGSSGVQGCGASDSSSGAQGCDASEPESESGSGAQGCQESESGTQEDPIAEIFLLIFVAPIAAVLNVMVTGVLTVYAILAFIVLCAAAALLVVLAKYLYKRCRATTDGESQEASDDGADELAYDGPLLKGRVVLAGPRR